MPEHKWIRCTRPDDVLVVSNKADIDLDDVKLGCGHPHWMLFVPDVNDVKYISQQLIELKTQELSDKYEASPEGTGGSHREAVEPG